MRIFGHKILPSFSECYQIADYNHGEGGNPAHAVELLEDHFNLGILCEVTINPPKIRDAMMISLILSFTTTCYESIWNTAESLCNATNSIWNATYVVSPSAIV